MAGASSPVLSFALGVGVIIVVSMLVLGELFGQMFGTGRLRRGLVIWLVMVIIMMIAMVLIDIGSEPRRDPKALNRDSSGTWSS